MRVIMLNINYRCTYYMLQIPRPEYVGAAHILLMWCLCVDAFDAWPSAGADVIILSSRPYFVYACSSRHKGTLY